MNLKVISYNCRSARLHFDIIKLLTEQCDILMLQETLLNDENVNILEGIDSFNVAHTSSTRRIDNFNGRSSGGLVIMWRNFPGINVLPMHFNERVMGLKIQVNGIYYLLLNIYCICDYRNPDCLVEYIDTLSFLKDIMTNENCCHTIIAGDFNCDPNKGRFFNELNNFVIEQGLKICDVDKLDQDTYTYISDSNNCSTSWIDHVLCTDPLIVDDISVLYGVTFYDHIPLKFIIRLPVISNITTETVTNKLSSNPHVIAWSKVNDDIIKNYQIVLDQIVENHMNISMNCNEKICNESSHYCSIDNFFYFLQKCILDASKSCLPAVSKKDNARKIVGWNDFCREKYDIARDHFLLWNSLGRMRTGAIFNAMTETRANFKRALNYCRSNEQLIKKQKLVDSYQSGDKNCFWRDVRKLSSKLPAKQIDGKSDQLEITKIFSEHYQNILVDESCFSNYDRINLNDDIHQIYFQEDCIDKAIDRLNTGLGFDMIHSNHFKFAGKTFRKILGRFYSTCLKHSYVPSEMIKGIIRPVQKPALCKSKSTSYRPVMNSCMSMKILEYCLMPTLSKLLNIDTAQFGFQSGSNCDFAISMVKETILYYKNKDTSVHGAAIDLSNAYDKVNHDKLLEKLQKSNVPPLIIKIWQFIFSNTNVAVKFGDKLGDWWKVKNGLRQGGCTSALFFAFYIDEVLSEIKKLNIGCSLKFEKMNIIAFADDIFILSPSAKGLQKLVDVAVKMFHDLNLTLKPGKSKYIFFKHRKNINEVCSIKLNGVQAEKVDKIKYLGVYITENLDLSADCDRMLSKFLRQFNSLYYEFNFLPEKVLSFLFKSYCTSFYGLNLWFEEQVKDVYVKKLEIAYHKAIKRVAKMNVWESNHVACEKLGINIFKHFLSMRLIKYYFSIINAKSKALNNIKYYMMLNSNFYKNISQRFSAMYDIDCIVDNDKNALVSRINFIQRNEPRSNYTYNPDL